MKPEITYLTAAFVVTFALAWLLRWAYNADVKRQTQYDDDFAQHYFGKDGWPK